MTIPSPVNVGQLAHRVAFGRRFSYVNVLSLFVRRKEDRNMKIKSSSTRPV